MSNKRVAATRLLSAFLLIAMVQNACLDATTLASLGFSKTQTATVNASATICKDLFAGSGSCVPDATVQAKLDADNDDLLDAISVYNKSANILIKLQDSKDLTDAQKKQLNTIQTNMQSTQQQCLTAWNQIQQGITCYLASADASENTSVTNQVIVNVDTDKVGTVLDACLGWIDGLCLLTTGVSISTGISLNDSTFQKEIDTYGKACNDLTKYYNCDASDTACLSSRHSIIINSIFQPYNYDFFPDTITFDGIKSDVEKQFNKIKNWFKDAFSRRLVEESTTRTAAKSGGQDAATNGQNSGVQTETVNSVAKMLISIVATLAVVMM